MTEETKYMLPRMIACVAVISTVMTIFDVKVLHYTWLHAVTFWILWNVFYFVVLRPLIDRFIIKPMASRTRETS